jgi:YVTN family beta-propeller protein
MPESTALPEPTAIPEAASYTLIVTNSAGRAISFVDPRDGTLMQLEVGAAPWGLALAPDDTAYVATAEGVAVLDTIGRERVALIQYQAQIGEPGFGEYRPGGMGIAVAPDGSRVYVGVFLPDRSGRLEVIDAAERAVIASVPIGVRPFQVLASPDGRAIYTIDHDTFTVTAIDTETLTPRSLAVEPLGNTGWGSWDKPHYAVLRADGHLLLPIQGRVLVDLDPESGESVALPLQASTHQHGAALTPDGRRLLIVGTGPAGDARGQPRLTLLDLSTMDEVDIPLSRPHEQVALSPDGRLAYVTGGHSFANGGWDGLSVVDLARRSVTELPVPDRPLDIVVLR